MTTLSAHAAGRHARGLPACLALCTLLALAAAAPAQTLARKGWAGSGIVVEPWYRQAVFYQLDPVSFQDSNGDGFGDLNGVTERLDYLEHLGVDAIVLSPLALEPAYARSGTGPAFDPVYGTLDDLDRLIAAASSRHLRVLADLRLDQARSPAEAAAAARFWLTRGVGGLHLVSSGAHTDGDPPVTAAELAARREEVRRVVAAAPGERVLLVDAAAPPDPAAGRASHHHRGGTSAASPAPGRTPPAAELELDREPLLSPSLSAGSLGAALLHAHLPGAHAGATHSDPAVALASDAPDRERSFDRYGDAQHAGSIARAVAMALLTTPAIPVLYFGQEIAMQTTPAHGPSTARPPGPPDAGAPTPMQWGADEHGGFTTGTPWMEPGANAAAANVSREDADPDSLLSWYRRLIGLRHRLAALRDGGFVLLQTHTPGVVAWMRPGARIGGIDSPSAVVLVNLSANPNVVSITEVLRGMRLLPSGPFRLHTLAVSETGAAAAQSVATKAESLADPAHLALPPYGSYAGELTTQRGLESVATPVHRSRRTGR